MKSVRFHPAADDDLLAATEWYVDRSAAAAAEFVHQIEHATDRIAHAPERYPRTRFGCRRFVMLRYPFDVVYRVRDAYIEIVAVAHHARQPAYWRNR